MASINWSEPVNNNLNDEEFAFNLQKEEIEAHTKKYNRSNIRKPINITNRGRIQRKIDDDVIIIDDKDSSASKNNKNNRLLSTGIVETDEDFNNRSTNKIDNITELDEAYARKLQEELDAESALSINKSLFNSNTRERQNFGQSIHKDRYEPQNHKKKFPQFQTDMLYLLSRDSSNEEANASAATSSDNNNLYNNRRIRYSNSNRNQQRPDILNSAFDFMNNDAFMNEFLNSTNPNHESNNSNNNNNNNTRTRDNNNNNNNRIRYYNSINNRIRYNNNPNNFLNQLNLDRDFNENDYENLLRLDDLNAIKKGLSKQEIMQLPSFEFNKIGDNNQDENSQSCSICFEDFEKKQKLMALACSHKQSRKCPLCQKDAINA